MSAAGRAAGFTLIELLVVLAVLGLIGGLVYPTMTQFSTRARLRDRADHVGILLETARARAIRTAAAARVDRADLAAGDPLGLTVSPAGGIVFYADGSATGGSVEIADASGALRYAVSPATGAILRAAP